MENVDIICFTENGLKTALNIKHKIYNVYKVNIFSKSSKLKCNVKDVFKWCEERFYKKNIIVFIGAVGIAVRIISPFVKNKLEDPAVIVIDEKANFVIPILSGHVGGANNFALYVSRMINSIPVITTATDINNVFSVDLWAEKNNFSIYNKDIIKVISSDLLSNRKVSVKSDFNIRGSLPKNVVENEALETGFYIGFRNKNIFNNTLFIVPRCIIIGIGCKKNTEFEKIDNFFNKVLDNYGINLMAIDYIASIDIKRDEKGLKQFCKKYNFNFKTFSSEELNNLEGNFTGSEFVKKTIGVDNVCERACAMGNEGSFIMRKKSKEGITMAIFLKKMEVCFYE